MDWVKRNLYFVIGTTVAVVLMVLAGLYLYSGWRQKNEVFEKLSAQYAELRRLYELNPNPGNEKVNNIQAAKEQQEQLRAFMGQTDRFFVAPPAIPSVRGTNKVTSEDFTSALRRTVAQLQKDAENASVTLPPDCYFSFEAQKTLMRFAPGSLDALAVQLGEVKAICDVLFAAKINALDNLRRERVSNDDYKGSPSDYLEQKSATNSLAVLVPYEITFRSFSAELAGVLNGLHGSPYCLLAKTVDVEPASAMPAGLDTTAPDGTMMMDRYASRYGGGAQARASEEGADFASAYANRYGINVNAEVPPAATPMPRYPLGGMTPEGGAADAFASRYASRYGVGDTGGERFSGGGVGRYGGEGGGGPSLGGIPYRPLAQPGAYGQGAYGQAYTAPTYPTPAYPTPGYPYGQPGMMPGAAAARGGLQIVLEEQPLRVTMLIHVVKLLPREGRR